MRTVWVNAGRRYLATMPMSEVCMHMKIVDKYMLVELVRPHAVQLYTLDGQPFSSTVTPGEAGLMWNADHGQYYFYPKLSLSRFMLMLIRLLKKKHPETYFTCNAMRFVDPAANGVDYCFCPIAYLVNNLNLNLPRPCGNSNAFQHGLDLGLSDRDKDFIIAAADGYSPDAKRQKFRDLLDRALFGKTAAV